MLSGMDYPDNKNIEEMRKNIKNLNLKESKGKVSILTLNCMLSIFSCIAWYYAA